MSMLASLGSLKTNYLTSVGRQYEALNKSGAVTAFDSIVMVIGDSHLFKNGRFCQDQIHS